VVAAQVRIIQLDPLTTLLLVAGLIVVLIALSVLGRARGGTAE
jgi:hypothetical protein